MPFLSTTAHSGKRSTATGLYPDDPGDSAVALKKANGHNNNGVYYVLVNGVSIPTYCIMDSNIAGGGWMMILKSATSATFQYASSYWTSNNVLNQNDTTTNSADAKFNHFNYSKGTDLLAHFPDMVQGGSLNQPGYGWTWYQPNFGSAASLPTGSAPITALTLFNSSQPAMNSGGSGYFIQDAYNFSGFQSGVWSSQVDIRFYGFNYNNNYNATYNITSKTRWGFGWNENGEGLYPGGPSGASGSNDCGSGIGLQYQGALYSAGDSYSCCGVIGINRSARVEMYIR